MTVGNVTITPEELDQLATKVSELLGTTAKDPSQWDEVTSLVGVTSLPVFKQVESMYSLVRVSLSVLKGVDGREISLQVNEDKTFIQWRYTDEMWQNLISVADLKGADGKTPIFKSGTTGIEWKYDSEPDTDYRVLVDYSLISLKFEDLTSEQISQLKLKFSDLTEADKAELMKPAVDAAEDTRLVITAAQTAIENTDKATKNANEAAANVKDGINGVDGVDGKTPVMQAVNAVSGSAPAGKWDRNGTDEAGNPRYILNITLPQGTPGTPGLPSVFEVGTVTTVNPSQPADVEVLENGVTAEGNPKYVINFTIPRGEKGVPGTGSGNVYASGINLVVGKKYLFVPDSDGSTSGTFVEYVVPEIPEQVQPDWDATEGKGEILNKPGDATSEKAGLMTPEGFKKLNKLNPSSLSNDITKKKVEYTDTGKLLFEGKETFAIDADGELTLDGKKMSELGGNTSMVEEVSIRISSNQAQPDIVLNGIVLTVKLGLETKEYTWNGLTITFKVPMNMLYSVTFPDIEGYSTPPFSEFQAVAGAVKEINVSYNTCVLTVNVSSNQGATSDLNNLPITLSGGINKVLNYAGSPFTVKIPFGKETTILPGQIEGYATVDTVVKNPTTAVDSVDFIYNTEFLMFYLYADNGVSTNGQIVTINGKEYTYNNAIMTKIPFGKSYTISVNDKIGYKTPAPLSLTADRVSRMESMTYTEIKRGVFILDTDKNLTRRTDWNTTNNSKAAGVAVLTDNCEFYISNIEFSANKWSTNGMLQVGGCTTTNVTGTAKEDYRGKENTLAIVSALEQDAPAAYNCNNAIMPIIGEKGYLGSVGEWQELFNNKTEIDACLSIIGYNELLAAQYWTSTQISNADAWRWRPNDGYLSQAGKVSNAYVRAFFKI